MGKIMFTVLRLGVEAGVLIPVVFLVRALFRRAPKSIRCVLWALVAVKLIAPVQPQSPFSLLPEIADESLTPWIDFGVWSEKNKTTNNKTHGKQPEAAEIANTQTDASETTGTHMGMVTIFSGVWLAGMGAMLLYAGYSAIRLRRRIRVSVEVENGVWVCDEISGPFLFGIRKPQIYLPSDLKEPELSYVLAHERCHIRRFDYLWKPFAFLLLAVYWWNPLVWASYLAFGRDMEAACDEAVIKNMDLKERQAYSKALLLCSVQEHKIDACPVAFGEDDVKRRIKAVLEYRKPVAGVVTAAAACCILLAVCFLTRPVLQEKTTGEVAALVTAISENEITVDVVEYVTDEDTERKQQLIKELSLTDGNDLSDGDFPDGYYIYNPSKEKTSFRLTEETVYTFLDWNRDYTKDGESMEVTTTDRSIFEAYLNTYTDGAPRMPFFLEVKDGIVVRVTEKWFA